MTPLFNHSLLYLFLLLKFFAILILSLDTSSDQVYPYDHHNSDLLVSLYDCSKQQNLGQFFLTRVQPCVRARFSFV